MNKMIFNDYIEMYKLRQCENDEPGDIIGYWCDDHVDIDRFYTCAVVDYEDDFLDDDPCDIIGDTIPFSRHDIKHIWYRYPTEQEQEQSGMHPQEFITTEKGKLTDAYQPITYLEFDI
jgi:hypothetical protein